MLLSFGLELIVLLYDDAKLFFIIRTLLLILLAVVSDTLRELVVAFLCFFSKFQDLLKEDVKLLDIICSDLPSVINQVQMVIDISQSQLQHFEYELMTLIN